MDTKLRTSFVPKKTFVYKNNTSSGSSVINPFLSLSVIIFSIAIAVFGGAYLYKTLIQKQIAGVKADLVKARDSFEEKAIEEWKRRDARIIVANELLNNHKVVSPVFSILEETTLRTTRFLDFNFTSSGVIKMTGEGLSYTSVALLSDSFNDEKRITNPVFSNLSLSEKGGVKFSFSGTLNPSVLSYKNIFNQ